MSIDQSGVLVVGWPCEGSIRTVGGRYAVDA